VHAVLGGELAFTADTDPGASAVLARRFPGVPNLGDIKGVDWVSLGAVDVLAGGYPCTPFSQAGKRLGAADERHVWPHFVTAIGQLRPGMVILENVQGHLTLGFDVVLADLAALGYDAEWVVVTASAAGAPHRRARLFVMAFPAGMRAVAGVPVAVISDGAWTEPRESLFGILPFAGRIPPSGRMAGGRVYAAPDGPTELSAGLLKTPTAQLAINGGSQHPDKRRAGGHGPTLADQVEHELLPTPTAREKGGRNARHGDTRHGDDLPEAIRYLPTPNATDWKGGNVPIGRMREGRPRTIADADLPAAVALLPTPTAADGDRASLAYERGNPTLIGALLPTPQATDGQGGPKAVPEERTHRGTDHGPRLRDVAPALLPTPTSNVSGRTPEQHMAMRESIGRTTPSQLEAAARLLPTPSVADGTGGHKTRSGDWKGEPLLGGIAMLLPTPTSMDSHGARNATARRSENKQGVNNDGWTLSDVVWQGDLPPGVDTGRLLPTPAAGNFNDGEDLASWEARRERNLAKGVNGNGQGTPLPVAAQQLAGAVDWGPYETAIRRWEAVTGRPAPAPTVPGKTGQRLNPALPEWMMGLPAGWITEVPGLSRNAQLKAAGNGVVPAQAELALRILLDRAGLTSLGRAA
jgi:site-specific DNA-cytosine methylase